MDCTYATATVIEMPLFNNVINGLSAAVQQARNGVAGLLNRTNEIRQYFENVEHTTGIIPIVLDGNVAQLATSDLWAVTLIRIFALCDLIGDTKKASNAAVMDVMQSCNHYLPRTKTLPT